jgi:hypothetical protein
MLSDELSLSMRPLAATALLLVAEGGHLLKVKNDGLRRK